MKRSRRGFSLIELMIVLVIAAIVLSIALPDLRVLIRQYHLKTVAGDLFGAIDLTRSEAIARGQRVMLAPLDEAGANWSDGWVVFVDHDGDLRPGLDDEIIAEHGPVPDTITISSVFTSQKQPYYLAYNASGRSCSASSSLAARWGTLSLFQDGQTRRIKINMLGRARLCDPARDGASCGGAEGPR
jgi:type IV fimbrial biogenesis protein FimT